MIEPILQSGIQTSPYDRYDQYQQYQALYRRGESIAQPPKPAAAAIPAPAQSQSALPSLTAPTGGHAPSAPGAPSLSPASLGQNAHPALSAAPSPMTPSGTPMPSGPMGAPAQLAFGQDVPQNPIPQGAEASRKDDTRRSEGANPPPPTGKRECQTCKERKYQDQSDDPGVSYQSPTNIRPEQAAHAVRAHENEHVSRQQAKAKQQGREVVSQSVVLKTAICPECGDVYVSGGTTTTVTRAAKKDNPYTADKANENQGRFLNKRI